MLSAPFYHKDFLLSLFWKERQLQKGYLFCEPFYFPKLHIGS